MVFQCLLVISPFTDGHLGFSSLLLLCRALRGLLCVCPGTQEPVSVSSSDQMFSVKGQGVNTWGFRATWCLPQPLSSPDASVSSCCLDTRTRRHVCIPIKLYHNSRTWPRPVVCGTPAPAPPSRRCQNWNLCQNTGRASVSPGSVEAVLTCPLNGVKVPVFTHLCSHSRDNEHAHGPPVLHHPSLLPVSSLHPTIPSTAHLPSVAVV